MKDEPRFLIISLPRSGSTTLARLLNCHEHVRCLIEPFHPHRYGGRFHAFAVHRSIDDTLAAIWTQWNGIKHVWDTQGFPFFERPELNNDVVLHARCKIVLLVRRNILRRIVSQHLSRETRTWIGPREAFVARLRTTDVAPLDPDAVRLQIRDEQAVLASQLRFLSDHHLEVLRIEYEDVFSGQVSADDQMSVLNDILTFLGLDPVRRDTFVEQCSRLLDPSRHQWGTPDVYHRIPGIERLEEAVGNDVTGWLFR
jgi:LPS sulfotransferase NodH